MLDPLLRGQQPRGRVSHMLDPLLRGQQPRGKVSHMLHPLLRGQQPRGRVSHLPVSGSHPGGGGKEQPRPHRYLRPAPGRGPGRRGWEEAPEEAPGTSGHRCSRDPLWAVRSQGLVPRITREIRNQRLTGELLPGTDPRGSRTRAGPRDREQVISGIRPETDPTYPEPGDQGPPEKDPPGPQSPGVT
ncbi:hypothetical protein NDU88_000020 [Pleurodeles waltl]|uniref:Uncharacterized protein n=1 Tax=Pleurodeles waltl TaxID=8319 RepID=A0AAV7LTD8_PLEWA|nr:hypothetical protein NDU88_000020 [Pleurodeles waltl]